MDVRCTKCGTEYEFDDAKVTAAGVTVKCTHCGHVFKVKRDESASVPPSPSTSFQPQSTFAKGIDGGEWMVKRVDGQVFRFKELTTLQKWIVERKVGRDDEISKTGKTWKKLGEIAELASFFQVVDAANAALQVSSQPVPAPPPVFPQPSFTQSTSPGMPAASLPPMTQGAVVGGASIHDAPTLQIPVHPGLAAEPAAEPLRDAAPSPPQAPSVPLKPAAQPVAQNDDDVSMEQLDEDDPVLQMIKRRRRNTVLAVVLLLVVGVGAVGAVFWPRIAPLLGVAPLPPSAAIETARKALRADRVGGLTAARAALDADKHPTPVLDAWRIRIDIATSAHTREQGRIHEVLAGFPSSVDHAAQAKQLKDAADSALAAAYTQLNKVRTSAPALVEGHLASAAYQLEKGGLPEQHADLEAARAATKQDAAVDAEIAAQQILADAHTALIAGDAKAILDKIPSATDDARLLYARAALAVAVAQRTKPPADAELAAARTAVQGLGDDDRAPLLLQLIDAITPKAAPVVVDAGPLAAADAGPASQTAPADAGTAAPTPQKPEETTGGYDVIIAKAERARVNDQSKSAHELFLKAAKLKPGAPRPWLGIGWTALDLGRNQEAVGAFKKALDLDENLADAEFGLAESLRFAGKKAEALDAYKTYLKMDPNGKDAGTAKRAIDSLQ